MGGLRRLSWTRNSPRRGRGVFNRHCGRWRLGIARPTRRGLRKLTAELFAPYDGVLRQRLDLAAALRSLRTELDTELEGALNRATRLNDAMLRAANASARFGVTQ